ncbi:MAG: AbrB/MazE/SpoVT family DNA-binding domain-containing protein [Thaumarchaeota archaeon]|nr:AbrB/MazE/SpoVT family DNA-binding domain-containing protein [Nitrososphaerota archaeon]
MSLRLKVGKKGHIILPKAVRDAVGIEEDSQVTVEINDGILLRPLRKIDRENLASALRKHLERITALPNLKEPKPREPAEAYLEEEFEA